MILKNRLTVELFTIFLITLLGISTVESAEYVPGEILIKFKAGAPQTLLGSTITDYSMTLKKTIASLSVHNLKIPKEYSVEEMVKVLSDDPNIEFVEPNYIYYALKTPDDLHNNQWGLSNAGQTITCGNNCEGTSATGVTGIDINAEAGWETQTGDPAVTTGATTITIAIIDTGIDLTHPDLNDKIVAGYDYVKNDSIPDDNNGHGTHVAGIAAAETDNNIGIAGVCWGCKIMPLKVLNSIGAGSSSDISSAISFAINNGASVINLSLGSPTPSSTLEAALKLAYDNNLVSVCAAGNTANAAVVYPAAYEQYCIAVSATDNRDALASFASTGPEVDVAAPGVDIYSTALKTGSCTACADFPTLANCGNYCSCNNDSQYGFCSGTSMSTPFASGLAGLILSTNPSYGPDQVALNMTQTAKDLGNANYFGSGRIKIQGSQIAQIQSISSSISDDSGACFISSILK